MHHTFFWMVGERVMSLINCVNKLSAGKNKDALAPEERADLFGKVTEHAKAMPRPEAERTAVKEVATQARGERDYIADAIRKQLKIARPKAEEQAPVAPAPRAALDEAPPIQAPEVPDNAYQRPNQPEVEPGMSPQDRQPGVTDAVIAKAQSVADKYMGVAGQKVVADVAHVATRLIGSMEFLHAAVTRIAPHMPSARRWHDALMAKEAFKGELERHAEVVARLADKLGNTGRDNVNRFVAEATVAQKWWAQPSWLDRPVAVDPAMKGAFDQLTPQEQGVANAIFEHGETVRKTRDTVLKELGADGMFAQRSALEGPYAPLKRFGGFVATLKSQALLDAERALKQDPSKANAQAVAAMHSSPKDYVMSTFDTPGQAHQFVKENRGAFAYADASTQLVHTDDRVTMPAQVLSRVMSAVGVNPDLPAESRRAMEDTVRAMWLTTLDEASARQSGQKRMNVAGYDKDMIKSFLADARAQAAYIANMKHGGNINHAFYSMKNEIAHPVTGARVGADDFNMLAAHQADSLKYNPTPIQDGVTALTSAWQLATSLSYHLANFTQTVMVTLPKLAADFGAGNYAEAWGHVLDGYKTMHSITSGLGTDLSLIKDKGLRSALEVAANRQLLDVGMTEDLTHFQRFTTGYKALDNTSAVAARAMHRLRSASSAVERWNRVSAGVAAYNMAIAKGRSIPEARQYMLDVLADTQGDFTRIGAPLILKKLPKVVTQYRKFQFMMMAQYAKAVTQAFRGATGEERAIGQRMLAFKMAHTTVAAGVMGLPFMGLASWIYDKWQDHPESLDTKINGILGDSQLGKLLHHGVLPGGLSAKLGDDKIFSPLPYTDIDLTSKRGLITTAAGILGPGMAQAARMATGVGLIKQGDLYKGAEKLMPKGLELAMQSYRMHNEGFALTNGAVLVKPSNISEFTLAMNAIGVPTDEIRSLTQNVSVQYEIKKYFTDNATQLQRAYNKTFSEKDTAAMADIRAKWMELQKEKDPMRKHYTMMPDVLKHQPLATLTGGPQRARLREMKAQREYREI